MRAVGACVRVAPGRAQKRASFGSMSGIGMRSSWTTRARVPFDLHIVEVAGGDHPGRELLACAGDARGDPTQIWHSKFIEGGSNYVSYDNPEADKLMEEARKTMDDEARQAMYRKFGKMLHDDQPYTWLYVPSRLFLIDKRIKGVQATLLWWQFEDWWLDE